MRALDWPRMMGEADNCAAARTGRTNSRLLTKQTIAARPDKPLIGYKVRMDNLLVQASHDATDRRRNISGQDNGFTVFAR